MALQNLEEYLDIVPAVMRSPYRYLWSSYDAEADVLYINFKKPPTAIVGGAGGRKTIGARATEAEG
ncbi:MAG: hypothetical protein M3362_05185 [Acidobacteriota bacterium]|nr:hypothetical protein [Acidobacteriota bacterium]